MVTDTFSAEYIGASIVAKHILWNITLLDEINPPQHPNPLPPTKLNIDNKSAISGTKKQSPAKKSKYIVIRHHHIQELVANKIIQTKHMPSPDLQADTLTKPLSPEKYIKHRNSFGVQPPPGHTHGYRDIINDIKHCIWLVELTTVGIS